MIDTSLLPFAVTVLVLAAVATVLAVGAIVVVVRDHLRDRRTPAPVRVLPAADAASSRRAA